MNSDVSVCSKANTSSKKLSILDKVHSDSNEIINNDVSSTILKALDEKGDGDVMENNSNDQSKNTTASNTCCASNPKSSLFTAMLMKSTKLSRITPIQTPSISSDTIQNSPMQRIFGSSNSPKWAPFGRKYSSKIDRIV